MQSDAATVEEYLDELPADRRAALTTVRETILDRLPDGYEEAMEWGVISYQVPLATCPDTYNGKPLMYAALASQKNHMTVYLTGVYADAEMRAEFEERYRATGKRVDMGRSCVRFRNLDDLPLELVGEAVAALPVDDFVELVQSARGSR